MTGVTHILTRIEAGDASAAEQLMPLLYDELRELAAARLMREKPGQTLQATALVHEVYVRLVDGARGAHWDSRGHFFAAAAEAMRRILIDNARSKASLKRGGEFERLPVRETPDESRIDPLDMLALDEALVRLEVEQPENARLVKLRYFAGCSLEDAAELLGISRATAQRNWTYARAWLFGKLHDG